MRNLKPYLVGWWRGVKNTSGTLEDFSDLANHATIAGASQIEGHRGQALLLNGTADYVDIDNAVNDLASDTQGTFVAWVRTDDITHAGEIVSFGDTDADTRIQFDIYSNGLLRALVGETGVTQWALDTDDVVFGDRVWTHVVLVQDGVSPVLYVDGIAVAQAFSTSTDKTYWFSDLSGLDNGRIGCGNWNGGGNAVFFDGAICPVSVYNTALTADEVESLYKEGARRVQVVPATKMRNYMEFNGSTDFIDIGSGYNGVKSVEFWAKPQTTTEYFVDLNGTAYVSSSGGTLAATGFTSPTIYVDGVASSTIVAGIWQHVVITTGTGINASDLDIGRIEGVGYLEGEIAEVRMYSDVLTATEIREHYDGQFKDESALVGYWKLDEAQSFDVKDSSTEGDDGSQSVLANQPLVIRDLRMRDESDPILFDPLEDILLSRRWVAQSGTFEPVYDAMELCYGIKCTSAGNSTIVVPEQLRDRSEQNIELTWKMRKAATTAPYLQFIANKSEDRATSGSQGYYFIMNADESVGLYRYNGGSYTELFSTGASYINDSQWYEIKFTITAAGIFTGFIDDVQIVETSGSNPTGVDLTYTNFIYLVLGTGIDDIMADFKISRY